MLRSICEENGLRVVLTHTDPARILNDTDAVIREHDILGCDYIGIGAMPEKYRSAFWLPHFIRQISRSRPGASPPQAKN